MATPFVNYRRNVFNNLKQIPTILVTADPYPIKVTSLIVTNTKSTPMRFNFQLARMDGLMLEKTCVAASVADLDTEYVSKGNFGIGDQLLGTSGTFTVDGVVAPVGSRILVKDQGLAYQNGIYTVTNVGSEISPWVLTRAVDFNTAKEVNKGDVIPVTNGTVNANTKWEQTLEVLMVGFDPITFIAETSIDTITGNEFLIEPYQTVNIMDITGCITLEYNTRPFVRDSIIGFSNGYTQLFNCSVNYIEFKELLSQ